MKTKIKYIPITFETPEELAKALLDGRRFRYRYYDGWFVVYAEECKFYSYKDGVDVVDCEVRTACITKVNILRKEEIVEEEVRWEDDLDKYPKGILCWVWDKEEPDEARISVIEPSMNFRYEDYRGTWWECARPLTSSEVLEYIYKEE